MKKVIVVVVIALILFSLSLGFYINKNPMPYNQYYGIGDYETPCELKQVDDGYVQLENCAKYKIKDVYLRRING